jgi:hypothetical protein
MTDDRPGTYRVECSDCSFNRSSRDADYVEFERADHEAHTKHRGPFIWFLSDELAARILEYRRQDYERARRYWS